MNYLFKGINISCLVLIYYSEGWGLGIGDWGFGPIPNPLLTLLISFLIIILNR